MLDPNRLTENARNAIGDAQNIALEHHNQFVDTEHLFLALMRQSEGLIPNIIEKMGVSAADVQSELNQAVERIPKVTGTGAQSAQVYITSRLNRQLIQAEKEAKN